MSELRKCICGQAGEADFFYRIGELDKKEKHKHVIRCSDDQGCGYMTTMRQTLQDAIKEWNNDQP